MGILYYACMNYPREHMFHVTECVTMMSDQTKGHNIDCCNNESM